MSGIVGGGPRIKLNSGYEIPLIGFGTYKITGQESLNITVNAALNAGYRHFDTAKLYANEPELGYALETYLPKYGLTREDIFITTKFQPPAENTVEKVEQLIEESLKNLKTDYLDLVLIHYPKHDSRENDDPQNAINRKDTWLTLEKLAGGKVHSIGVSNYEINHIEEIKGYSKIVPAVNQVEYHPHFRRAHLKEYCDKTGIFFQAFSSLARQKPELLEDPVVSELAKKYNTSPQRILLSFATSQRVGIVPKSENPERITDNAKCLDLSLTEEDLKKLNSIPVDQNYIRTVGWTLRALMTSTFKTNGGPRVKLNSGFDIPLFGLGTYKINDQETMDRVVDAALKCGYRLFDTATHYKNEPELGNSLQKLLSKHNLKREDIYITSKMHPRTENFPQNVADLVEQSLNGLQTDYVDLMLIHYPKHRSRDDKDPKNAEHRKGTWLELENISQIKLRSIGVSNFEVDHLEEMKAYATKMPSVNQLEYHPHFTRSNLKDYCANNGIFFQAYSSIGRHNPELINDPVVTELSKKYSTTPEVLLLSFATTQGVGVIPKTVHAERVAENVKCLDLTLTDTDIEKLKRQNKDKNYILETVGWIVD